MKLTLQQRQDIALYVQKWTFKYLVSHADIDLTIALRGSTDAANEHDRMLCLVLGEHGVEVQEAHR